MKSSAVSPSAKSGFDPSLKVGVLGGGQLGSMLVQAAHPLGMALHVMGEEGAPCSSVTPHFQVGQVNNYEDVVHFGQAMDVLTIEMEAVHVQALTELERQGVEVYPQPAVIELIQDKGLQKQFYDDHRFPTAPFHWCDGKVDIRRHVDQFPLVQKLRKGGYDGKGVCILRSADDIDKAFDAPSILEERVDLEKELSVIVARNAHGQIESFPVVEQVFHPEANLVELLFSPAEIEDAVAEKATSIAVRLIEQLNMVGLLAVEFFLDRPGNLWVNEMAPRPHNSGHPTIEGAMTSQFEQLLRAVTHLPLGSTGLIQPVAMVNLLGEGTATGVPHYSGLSEVLAHEGVFPHLYGKQRVSPFRKMGHVTVMHPQLEQAKTIALKVSETLRISAK